MTGLHRSAARNNGRWQIERFRRVRLGQVRKVLRLRYGNILPDDDAGREELFELLLLQSLHPTHPEERMRGEIAVWAPWMSEQEGQGMVNNVVRLPVRWRMANKVTLGERLNLMDSERTRAKAFSIMPVDVSEEELKERARELDRMRKALKRREERAKPRRIYESEGAAKTEPWKALGISRRTYYRRKEAGQLRGTSASAVLLRLVAPDTPVPPAPVERQQGRRHGR